MRLFRSSSRTNAIEDTNAQEEPTSGSSQLAGMPRLAAAPGELISQVGLVIVASYISTYVALCDSQKHHTWCNAQGVADASFVSCTLQLALVTATAPQCVAHCQAECHKQTWFYYSTYHLW